MNTTCSGPVLSTGYPSTYTSSTAYLVMSRGCRRCGRPFWPSRRYAECEACRALKAEPTPIYDEVEHALELFRNRQAISALIERGLQEFLNIYSTTS